MNNPRPTTLSIDDQLSDIFNREFITELNMEDLDLLRLYPERASVQSSPVVEMISTTTNAPFPTAASSVSLRDDNSSTHTIREEYQPRTLGMHNIHRLSILPSFPSVSSSSDLLLSNVPIESLTDEQYARIRYRAFSPLFKLQMDAGNPMNSANLQPGSCESFLLGLYHHLYIMIKKRLKVDIPVIDFNLIRLRNCINKVVVQRGLKQTMLNMDELALALEFYLQFDVDMFYLKTCSFNGVEPRLFDNRFREGLFCIDTPEARFAITPCDKERCFCCHSPCPRRCFTTDHSNETVVIPFSTPHIHRFANQYEAILNCPATCETNNCIYVLTCPCGQFDFIGTCSSQISFAEALEVHREEGNRIIREFLIGDHNINYITYGLKSDEKKANDKMWLYQHSPRCSVALQCFLDYNPDYWCFIPIKSIEVNLANTTMQYLPSYITNETMVWARLDEEIVLLMNNVPKPPLGFDFSIYQRQQQAHFFKYAKDRIIPLHNVDLYNADILAVLPNNTSELFQQLIESLFITHAECKLNEMGHLVYDNSDPNRALHGSWCANLTRRPQS